MERAAGFTHDDTTQTKLDKLDALLAQSSTSIENAALFADMLSLPNDGRYPTLDLTPQQRRQRTLEALALQVRALSRPNPVLMIFEDAHWTDPTSLELFSRIVDRDNRTPGAADRDVSTRVRAAVDRTAPRRRPHLNRLGEREIGAMIDRVIGNKALPDEHTAGHH